MIDRIKALFFDPDGPAKDAGHSAGHSIDELQLATAALLVEAACLDDSFDAVERDRIADLVRDRFELTAEEVEALLSRAEESAGESSQLYGFTRIIKDRFSHEERVGMIEMLWQVVYADGRLHDHEASLLRRVAGLIYVSGRESGEARKRVVARLAVEQAAAG